MTHALSTRLQGWLNVRPEEWRALLLAWLYVLSLFLAYYVLRPIRDELGAAGGVRQLPWLFTATLVAMLVLSPVYGALVRRWPRERFIAIAYRFFAAHLIGFAALMYWGGPQLLVWTGRAFFIWVSVFNLFVVSVFWSLMVDVFDTGQARRLFGFLTAGATLGGLLGSAFVSVFAGVLDQYSLLLVAVLLLEVAVQAARRLSRQPMRHDETAEGNDGDERAPGGEIGGSIWSGLTQTLRSPFLLGIATYILIYTITSTFLYFQQAEIVNAHFTDRAERTAFLARIDLWVNVLTLLCQLVLTGRLMHRPGMVVVVLCVLPLLSVFGFALLASLPTVGVFVAVQVARRVSSFAFAKPSREVLFTRLGREDRYKAKNFIDTVVYRSGDQVGSWGYAALSALGLGVAGIAWVAVPLCLVWLGLSVWLGRQTSR